jgi:hypothetical protein
MAASTSSHRAAPPSRGDWLDYTKLLAWASASESDATSRTDRVHRDAYQRKLGRRSFRSEYRRPIAPVPPPAN